MSAKEKIVAAITENPDLTVAELAIIGGVSRQRVHQILESKFLHAGKTTQRNATAMNKPKSHFGGDKKLSSHFVGGASELTACADLLRKGFPVYRALTFVSAADLIVDMRKHGLKRVEVRSAKKNKAGWLQYAQPADPSRYDILALVLPDGTVVYKPDILQYDENS